jgi:hypothetical protein
MNSFNGKRSSLQTSEKPLETIWDPNVYKEQGNYPVAEVHKSANFRDHHRSMENLEKYQTTPGARASFAEFKSSVHR